MSTVVLPTRTDGVKHYEFSTTLDGIGFTFTFDFNDRDGFWYFVLSDGSGVQLLARKVVIGWLLLGRFMDLRLPPGDMVAIDTSGEDQEAGLADLGQGARVQLCYIEAADLPA